MKRFFIDLSLALIVSIVYLFAIIAVRVPFYIIFLIGCVLFIIGLIAALFFEKGNRWRRLSMMISLVGLLSALLIWLLVHVLLAGLQ